MSPPSDASMPCASSSKVAVLDRGARSLHAGVAYLNRQFKTLAIFAVVCLAIWRSPGRLMTARLTEIMDRGHSTTSQTAVRWTVVLLLFLLGLAAPLPAAPAPVTDLVITRRPVWKLFVIRTSGTVDEVPGSGTVTTAALA